MRSKPGDELRRRAALPLGLAAALAGCANEQPPPGALPDTRPPQVVRFVPPRDSVVPELDGSARIHFDEPVRLSGDLSRLIRSSPAYRYGFETGFSEIRIRPEGGWREGAVYCFEVDEGIVDLVGNRTDAPIPFCFSTGPAVSSTRVEGRVVDRVTGTAAGGARVLFLGLPADTTPYTAEANPQGEFSLRALPPGGYWAYAFQDRNRDLRLDRRLEPHDSVRFRLDAAVGAEPLDLALFEPDSTPPALVGVRAEDSLTVRVEFDDPLQLDQPTAGVVVADSAGAELTSRRIHVGEPASLPREDVPREEPEAGDQPPAQEPPPGEPPVEEPPARDLPAAEPLAPAAAPPGGPRSPQEAERRPSRIVTVLLEEPLVPGAYTFRARGFVNLRDLVGGGDTTFVFPPEPVGR